MYPNSIYFVPKVPILGTTITAQSIDYLGTWTLRVKRVITYSYFLPGFFREFGRSSLLRCGGGGGGGGGGLTLNLKL